MQYFKNPVQKVKNFRAEIISLVVVLRRAQIVVFAYLNKLTVYRLLKKAFKSLVVSICLIALLWGLLYHLTDWSAVITYLEIGVAVCFLNTLISNLQKRKVEQIIYVSSGWIIMAGVVLVLYHTGFIAAAVFAAAVFLASPFFGASVYEGIVGLSLLITLAWQQ